MNAGPSTEARPSFRLTVIRLSKSNLSGPRQEDGLLLQRGQTGRLQGTTQGVVGVDFSCKLEAADAGRALDTQGVGLDRRQPE